jgi:hypothetical protein
MKFIIFKLNSIFTFNFYAHVCVVEDIDCVVEDIDCVVDCVVEDIDCVVDCVVEEVVSISFSRPFLFLFLRGNVIVDCIRKIKEIKFLMFIFLL